MQDAVSLPCIRSLCIREILHEYSSFAVFTRMCYLKHTYSTIQTFRKTFNRRLAPNEFSKAHLIIEISKLLCNLYFSSNKYYYILLFFFIRLILECIDVSLNRANSSYDSEDTRASHISDTFVILLILFSSAA